MKKRLTAICLTAALALSLCGCGGVYEKTYEVVSDYVPAAQTSPDDDGRVVVKSYQALKLEISELVSRGVSEGKIAFDERIISAAPLEYGRHIISSTAARLSA